MRKFVLPSLLLAACGSEDPAAADRSWKWSAPDGTSPSAAALLPNGETFVALPGAGVFLDGNGEAVKEVDLTGSCPGCAFGKPLVVGGYALFGPADGGEPLLRVEPAARNVRHLPVENPFGLVLDDIRFDGRLAAPMANGTQMLVPGRGLVEISVEGIVTETHPTGRALAVTHVQDDTFAFLKDNQALGLWHASDNSTTDLPHAATRIAGGDGFAVFAVQEEGALRLHRYAEPLLPMGPAFHHEIELAVAPAAQRIVVGVLDRDLDGTPAEDAPEPGTVLVLDGSGATVAEIRSPAALRALDVSADGKNVIVTHAEGVSAYAVK